MGRSFGLDVHRSFAQIAVVEDGLCRDEGRIGVRPEDLRAWAESLRPDDQVVLEATTNSDAIATMLRPLVRPDPTSARWGVPRRKPARAWNPR